jgi:hypothetical protein
MKDWRTLRCNPLYLFISSFIVSNDKSISNFDKCVNEIASTTIDKSLSKATLQQQNIAEKISTMSEEISNSNSQTYDTIDKIKTRNYDISNNIINIINQQNENIELIQSYDLSNNSINQFTEKVNDIFNNIKSYLPNIKI